MPLTLSAPNHCPGEVPHLENERDFLRWRHLPPNHYLLGIKPTQAAAKAFRQFTHSRRQFLFQSILSSVGKANNKSGK